jgi:hypothetical protein
MSSKLVVYFCNQSDEKIKVFIDAQGGSTSSAIVDGNCTKYFLQDTAYRVRIPENDFSTFVLVSSYRFEVKTNKTSKFRKVEKTLLTEKELNEAVAWIDFIQVFFHSVSYSLLNTL